MIPGSANPLLLKSAAAAGGLQIERSLRFNSSDSAYLSRTPGTASNRKTWTWDAWVKRSTLGTKQQIFGVTGVTDADYCENYFGSDDKLYLRYGYNTVGEVVTAQVFRDPSSWYHILFAFDVTQATVANRLRLYVNGVEVTTFSTDTRSTLTNTDWAVNRTATHYISGAPNGGGTSQGVSGYLTNIHFIDGQALTPSSFTETDATTGQLIPKTYTGSYGTNGFNLLFADNSSNTASTLGKDTSGLGNNWTPNNLSINTGGPTSVAAASGALPVFNTTDTYGAVKGTGTRTDTNSASIVLALPMDGTNGGTSFGDQSAVIRGSGSAKTATVNGNTNTSTTQSKFYGSSGYFDGSGDYLSFSSSADFAFGSGDFTAECWFNVTTNVNYRVLLDTRASVGSSTGWILGIDAAGSLYVYSNGFILQSAGGAVTTGAWHHTAYTRSGSTHTLFLNGVAVSTTTTSRTYSDTTFAISSPPFSPSEFFDGYIQDARLYKGVAKYTGNFNPPSSTANPTIGAGNDSLVDSPVNGSQSDTGVGGEVRGNYCTLNPLLNGSGTISDGNLRYIGPSVEVNSTLWGSRAGTIAVSSGKWYFEVTAISSTSQGIMVGITKALPANNHLGSDANGYAYFSATGNKWNNGSAAAYGATWTDNDVIGCAFDADAGTLVFYKNNTSQGTAYSSLSSTIWFLGLSCYSTATAYINFGQRAFAYTAPSGFKALNTANLPAPLVTKSNTVMDVVTYTGTGAALTPTSSLGFNPDWIWIKSRSAATDHALYDVVRGAQARLESNTTDAEVTTDGGVTAFNSAGFTLGTLAQVNTSAATYVAWCWDAGTSTVSNTQGSITSQVRANATAGFSVVTWTGNGVGNETVGHGLGVAPKLYFVKQRSGTSNFVAFTTNLIAATTPGFLNLNGTNALAAASQAIPTSSLLNIITSFDNISAATYVAYCFAPVVGYSSFGSYVGNGNATTGNFIYTGFRPRWLLYKASSQTGLWNLFDAARNPGNVANNELFASTSDAETSAYPGEHVDLLSNGFRLVSNGSAANSSGVTYVYAAFAEAPFNYARAR